MKRLKKFENQIKDESGGDMGADDGPDDGMLLTTIHNKEINDGYSKRLCKFYCYLVTTLDAETHFQQCTCI